MRPVLLKMAAFGPYLHEQIVDFAGLRGRNFFLIHGPTGSGKTSLLDAMCFALYGRSSGDRDTFRSHHADATQLTAVVFEFELGDRRYRAERRMTKGGNIVPRLEEWKDHAWTILIERKEFAAHIKQLLGFDVDQFRQVVMLPQGQFSRFLLATSKEKETILKTLFGTDRYEEITRQLKDRAYAESSRYAAMENSRQTLLGGQGALSLEELKSRLPALENELEANSELQSALTEERKRLDTKISEAEALQKIFLDHDSIEEQWKRCLADESSRNRDEKSLNEAERAALLEDRFNRLEETEKMLISLKEKLEIETGKFEVVKKKHQHLRSELEREELASAVRDERRKRIAELQRLLPGWQEYAALRDQKQELDLQLQQLEAERQRLLSDRKEKRTVFERQEQELYGLRKPAATRPVLEQSLVEWERILRQHTLLNDITNRRLELQKHIVDLNGRFAAVQAELQSLVEQIQIQELKERQEQAALLAVGLNHGDPCPVCGSMEHPHPAMHSGDSSSDELKALSERQEMQRREAEELMGLLRSNQKEEELIAERIHELQSELADWSDAGQKDLVEEGERRRELLKKASEAESQEKELQQLKDVTSKELVALETAQEELRENYARLADEKSRVSAQLEEKQRSYGSITDPDSLKKELDLLQEQHRTEEQRLLSMRKELEDLVREEATAAATIQSIEVRSEEEKKHLHESRLAFTEQLTGSGFADEKSFLAARMPVQQRDILRKKIQQYDVERKGLENRFQELQLQVSGRDRPDLESLLIEKQRLHDEETRLGTENGILSERRSGLQKAVSSLDELEREQSALRQRREILVKLAEAAGGTSGRKITLQRYVLAYRLEEVLGYASEQLRRMTNGRYALRRATESEDLRQTAGLDLVVYDHQTGRIRPVSSLSGGESFLASLALALALSSAVQSRTGGIRLDTILIDEGFGSLDPEALDLAISTLKRLQQGGRMVGVISHVEEIRYQVEARIEVIPGPAGSRLSMHV